MYQYIRNLIFGIFTYKNEYFIGEFFVRYFHIFKFMYCNEEISFQGEDRTPWCDDVVIKYMISWTMNINCIWMNKG